MRRTDMSTSADNETAHGRAAQAPGQDTELDRGFTGVIAVLAGHARTGPETSAPPAGQQRPSGSPRDFADIWAAFADLTDALGLPQSAEPARAATPRAGQRPPGPGRTALDHARAEAQSCAHCYHGA